jgi:hypothetical protein
MIGILVFLHKDVLLLGRVDIYVRRVHNSPISPNRRGEVSSPLRLENPTTN